MNNRMKEKYNQVGKGCKKTIQQFSIHHFAPFSNAAEAEQAKADHDKKAVIFSQAKPAEFYW